MPNVRGWLVGAAGVGLFVAGLLFGAQPLEQVGFGLIVLVIGAVAVVRLGRHDLEITRTVSPERARAGQPVQVTLRFTNRGRGSAPLMLLEDRLPKGLAGRGRFTLNGVEPEGRREVSYQVVAHQRGLYEVGPLSARMVDPFSLAQLGARVAPSTTLMVHPKIEKLTLPQDQGEKRSAQSSALRQLSGGRGEEFYTLREYAQGDDLRKVHWASTAKRGRYMIRQEETPWHTRATVVIDDRRWAHDRFGDSSSFERAVEAAASVLSLYQSAGYGFRLIGVHSAILSSGRGVGQMHQCLDHLSMLRPLGDQDEESLLLGRLGEIEGRGIAEATLILIGGTIPDSAAIGLARLKRLFRQVIVVSFPAHRFSSDSTKARWEGEKQTVEISRLLNRSGVRTVVLGPGDALAPAWSSLSSTRMRGGDAGWAPKPELV
ncbi:MAG: hypothetical protein QOG54_1970 [Actinomycetota bacterium]|nr:hypothetical protein [Actinomycetota bacterium]